MGKEEGKKKEKKKGHVKLQTALQVIELILNILKSCKKKKKKDKKKKPQKMLTYILPHTCYKREKTHQTGGRLCTQCVHKVETSLTLYSHTSYTAMEGRPPR